MAAKFNKEQFVELAKQIKEEVNLDIQTHEEMEKFAKENPKQYKTLLERVKTALNDSVIGGTFEELNLEQMEALQGAGDVNAETSPGCITAGIAIGIWISGRIC